MPDSNPLDKWDADYDPEWKLTGETAKTPGYHTRIPDGVRIHSTRTNLDYALALMDAGPQRHARAGEVIDAVLALQDTDPSAPTYGIWPWFAEEPLPQMAPPDWNWADFCGALIAELLHRHGGRFEPGREARMRAALGHAAWSIFRRNMHPGYTNIALMGAAVTAAAGELLGEARLVEYARARFARFAEYTARHGSFSEYNSPTYTVVAIEECERASRLCADAQVRRIAEQMRRKGWEMVADHFFAPCFEWGGPQSRAYFDRLRPKQAAWLRERLDAPADAAIACPAELRPAFLEAPRSAWTRHAYQIGEGGQTDTVGSVWRDSSACLGSINRGTFWVQSRPVLGYWPNGANPAAVFRVRFLKDGRDFASAEYFGAQEREGLLSRIGFRLDQGDHHCGLDRPERPIFTGGLWCWRFQLDAVGAVAEARGPGFTLSAGDRRVDISPAECLFDGREVTWRHGRDEDGVAWVDAVCHEGAPAAIDLSKLGPTRLVAACRVVGRDESAPMSPPEITAAQAGWNGLLLPLGNG